MSGYCDSAPGHEFHGPYHDTEYGFPSRDERALFERLSLEIMQAGLSWEIVLRKRKSLNQAFDRFQVKKVASYKKADINRLLKDASIIRNRLKILAIISNAQRVLEIRQSHGSFAQWLEDHHPLAKGDWVKLFRNTFKFTGGEIVGEFLMSLGILPGAHRTSCATHKRILKEKPLFMKTGT